MRKLLARFVATAVLTAIAAAATADTGAYPSKPVRLVVPFTAGGTNDLLARLIQEPLAKALGQPVVVENKPGAGGTIGAKQVSLTKDGYAVLFTNSSLITTSLVQKSAGFDPLADLTPVVMASNTPLLLMAHPSVPFTDLKGMLDYARANPGKLEYAVAGPGSFAHLAIEHLSQTTGTRMLRVVYPGGAQTTAAVVSGEVKIQLTTPTDAINQFIQAGKIRAIAVSSPSASPIAPGVPPVAQTVPGYAAEAWFGLFVGAGTPQPIVEKLNAAINIALDDSAVSSRIQELGMIKQGGAAHDFGKSLKQEYATFGKVVQAPEFSTE